MGEKFVFHGSPKLFDSETANPKRNQRMNEEGVVTFDENSFHATPHKWIALAYTYLPKKVEGTNNNLSYGMGVDLYSNTKEVFIYGVGTLEESLAHLYGEGGFLYHFADGDFVYKEGLGSEEVIATSPTMPYEVEKVDNPVDAMKKLGVRFTFIDMSLPENQV